MEVVISTVKNLEPPTDKIRTDSRPNLVAKHAISHGKRPGDPELLTNPPGYHQPRGCRPPKIISTSISRRLAVRLDPHLLPPHPQSDSRPPI